MRALTLAFTVSLARRHRYRRHLSQLCRQGLSLGRHRLLSWCAMAVDAVGTGTAGATNRAIGSGVTAFQTKVVMDTTAGARGGTIPTQIGAVSSLGGVGVIHSERHARRTSPRQRSRVPADAAARGLGPRRRRCNWELTVYEPSPELYQP
jgi:hypothetical protein